jgi:hypothetical protein
LFPTVVAVSVVSTGDHLQWQRLRAAIGAGVGALHTVMQDRRANEAQHQAYNASTQSYDRAYGACLRGRGYTVN